MCSGRPTTKGPPVQYIGRRGPRSGADDAIVLPGRLLEEVLEKERKRGKWGDAEVL